MAFPTSAAPHRPVRVTVIWHGLPAYAARLLRSVADAPAVELTVIGTESPADPEYLQRLIGRPVHWIEKCSAAELRRIAAAPTDLCLRTGWGFPECNALAATARANGARVCMMIDNRWRADLRQWLGGLYFRVRWRGGMDYAWVPGESATVLCGHFGIPRDRVVTGLYGGDAAVFHPAAAPRPERIGFVGQHIRRKGLDVLLNAFSRLRSVAPHYELHLYGAGDLQPLAQGQDGVQCHPFAEPEAIAAAMRTFRIFVMPSRDDNWPLALHEAALSGCALVATDAVGNAAEFITAANGAIVPAGDAVALCGALRRLTAWDDRRFREAEAESVRRAEPYGPWRWREAFFRLCRMALDAGADARGASIVGAGSAAP